MKNAVRPTPERAADSRPMAMPCRQLEGSLRSRSNWARAASSIPLAGCLLLATPLVWAEGQPAPAAGGSDFFSVLFVFVLSTFIGLGVITRVSRLLHTPLMSLTNAISAIAVVGSIVVTGLHHPPLITLLGAIALFASMTNIVSGFLITDRMLKMFKSQDTRKS